MEISTVPDEYPHLLISSSAACFNFHRSLHSQPITLRNPRKTDNTLFLSPAYPLHNPYIQHHLFTKLLNNRDTHTHICPYTRNHACLSSLYDYAHKPKPIFSNASGVASAAAVARCAECVAGLQGPRHHHGESVEGGAGPGDAPHARRRRSAPRIHGGRLQEPGPADRILSLCSQKRLREFALSCVLGFEEEGFAGLIDKFDWIFVYL